MKFPKDYQFISSVEKLSKVAQLYIPSNNVFPISIKEFDKAMDKGLREGELIIISGQTGHGKTLFSQIIAQNYHKIGVPSLFFSYEMNPYYLNQKFIRMGATPDLLVYSPLELLDNKLNFIEEQIIVAKKEACKIVIIDHLHYLIQLQEVKNSSLVIGGIVRKLKQLAIKHNIIMILIAHTKKIYQDERLDLSSIRDSSLISQEADYVFLVERLKKDKKLMEQNEPTEWTNQTRITLAKNRRTGENRILIFDYKNGTLIPVSQNKEINVKTLEL